MFEVFNIPTESIINNDLFIHFDKSLTSRSVDQLLSLANTQYQGKQKG